MRRLLLCLGLLSACSPAALDPAAWPTPADWFRDTYEQSRDRFIKDCERQRSVHSICRSWLVPTKSGERLSVNYGFFSRGGDRLLILQSGIHGTEAASGAAIQAFVMNNYLDRLLDKGIDVLVIHAVNPWGFKHGRRNDEFNVNLNRNFSVDGSDYRFDNANYRRFQPIFEPGGAVASPFWGSLRGSLGFAAGFIGGGFKTGPLNNGLDNGQYEFPHGINYGGEGPQAQTRFLKDVIGPILARPYAKELYLDFHTGLGKHGALAVIPGKHPAPRPLWELRQMLQRYAEQGVRITLSSDPGFFTDYGDVIDFVPSLSHRPDSFLAVTMEFGTIGADPVSQLESVNRIILDNQKHNFGCVTQDVCDEIDHNTREMFNPSDPSWRQAVLHEADLVFRTLLEKF